MRRSKNTLLGRVHEQVALEARHEVEALYGLVDPAIRGRLERERPDEPELTLAAIRRFVESVRDAEVEEVEILDAKKVSPRLGGRPGALVRSVVRYNATTTHESRTVWVRDEGVWYSRATSRPWGPLPSEPEPTRR